VGKKASAIFAEADLIGGVVGKMRLAALATITSTEAAAASDTPELIARLEAALTKLRKTSTPERASPIPDASPAGPEVLRGHLQAYVELMSQRAVVHANLATTIARVTETAAGTLGVERVSVWQLRGHGGEETLECLDLYRRETGLHSSGTILAATHYPHYFAALARERTIAAHDANGDTRTSEFSQSYLRPLGIGAMLDVPIWVDAEVFGVLCHEHVGGPRTWTGDEERFAYLLSHFVALALEKM
jgi:hypothetical protein